MSMYPAHFYEPQNGIQPGMKPPQSLPAGAFPEPDAPRVVHIAVSAYPAPTRPLPRERAWALCWAPAAGATRVLGTVRAAPDRDSFVYWGPMTLAGDAARERGARLVPVASLSRGKRAALERIAQSVGVMRPNGWWNGQNWVVEVLKRAVEEDLISPRSATGRSTPPQSPVGRTLL
ncbi:hypothetical protein BC834DRAFT_845270 [Gloeopeniophorella convolvens]|nr:hypothetical protein BC834DRAFT_845270 [Gloeopeniophorella convolvens]